MFQKAKITLDFRSKFDINKPGGTAVTDAVANVVGVAPGTLISRKEDKVKPERMHTLTPSDQKLINTKEKLCPLISLKQNSTLLISKRLIELQTQQ